MWALGTASYESTEGTVLQSAIVSSRIGPSFPGFEPLAIGTDDYGKSEFEDRFSTEQHEEFDYAWEGYKSGNSSQARSLLREFLCRFPYHIDTYQNMGVIEHRHNRSVRAFKYFETGYRIGMTSIRKV